MQKNMQKQFMIALVTQLLICDRDTYIAVAGGSKKEYLNKSVSELVEKIMEDRHSVIESPKGQTFLCRFYGRRGAILYSCSYHCEW